MPVTIPFGGPCDLACGWCNYLGTPPSEAQPGLDQASIQLEQTMKAGAKAICFGVHHSEPTTNRDLPQLIKRAHRLGFREIGLSTSGLALSNLDYLDELNACGLSRVILTVVSCREDWSDLLLGRSGATAAKMKAIANCDRRRLPLFVAIMLLRPLLAHVVETVTAVRARAPGSRLTVHGCLMDHVPDHQSWRDRMLWPRYGELAWAMRELHRHWDGFTLQANELPLCVRPGVPGTEAKPQVVLRPDQYCKPKQFCEGCPLSPRCQGIPTPYVGLVNAPPLLPPDHTWTAPAVERRDVKCWLSAARAVARLSQGPWPAPLGRFPRGAPWTWLVCRAFSYLGPQGTGKTLRGFHVAQLRAGPDKVFVKIAAERGRLDFTLTPAGAPLQATPPVKQPVDVQLLVGTRLQASHSPRTILPPVVRSRAVQAFLALAEKAVEKRPSSCRTASPHDGTA
jgi:hypothetical protein